MWTEAVFLLCPHAVFWGQLSTLEIGDLLSPHYFNCFFLAAWWGRTDL